MNFNDENFDENLIKNAQFFTIRSTCDDNIHKSIKYGIWTSSFKNNIVFRNTYLECKKSNTPIFFFFTVVGSEQYIGVATMVGDTDQNKNFNYWWEDAKYIISFIKIRLAIKYEN